MHSLNQTTKYIGAKLLKKNGRLFLISLNSNISTSKPSLIDEATIKNIITPTKQYDLTQMTLFNEKCILVDQNDKPIGPETKKNCHLLENINKGMLHRAFSVFLFDKNEKLLLQQRSMHKITYPNHWTNTCCSHPLYIKDEMTSEQDHIGIKRAAIRRLNYELGIETKAISINQIDYLTRIQYRAENIPSDGVFGEHEIDYVLFLKGNFELDLNKNEVKDIKYVSKYELKELIEEEKNPNSSILLTPWFKLICEKFLFNWWSNLKDLKSVKDYKTIHRF